MNSGAYAFTLLRKSNDLSIYGNLPKHADPASARPASLLPRHVRRTALRQTVRPVAAASRLLPSLLLSVPHPARTGSGFYKAERNGP